MSQPPSDATIELGRLLVAQLDCDRDVLSSWMAHRIAELIARAESAPACDEEEARRACERAILDVWTHRLALREAVRPMKDVDRVIQGIAELAGGVPTLRYGTYDMRLSSILDEPGTARDWLELAIALDEAGSALVRYSLKRAAVAAVRNDEEWIKRARAARVLGDEHSAIPTLAELVAAEEAGRPPGTDNGARAPEEVAALLERLAKLAGERAAELRAGQS